MITIDGSYGEGGGQILRSSLSLSLVTGKQFVINNIRAQRSKPGLRLQHLKSVEAAKVVGDADVDGDSLGSKSVMFKPKGIFPGRFKFDINSAGSTSLVLQTVVVPLSLGKSASSITITGGTHVPWSPSYEYLKLHWLPTLQQIGFQFQIELEQAGFYPKGGGSIQARINPASYIRPLNLVDRDSLLQIRGISAIANLDRSIAERQRNQVLRRLGDRYSLNDIRIKHLPARFKGTFLLLIADFEKTQACFFSLGELGKPAEQVANQAVDELEYFLNTNGAIDKYLADQLLLPLALANGVSHLSTSQITKHLVTNAHIISIFLPVNISVQGNIGKPGMVVIDPHQE